MRAGRPRQARELANLASICYAFGMIRVVNISVTESQHEMLTELPCLSPGLEEELAKAKKRKGNLLVQLSVDNAEELLDSISAEANHSKGAKQEKYDMLADMLEEHL